MSGRKKKRCGLFGPFARRRHHRSTTKENERLRGESGRLAWGNEQSKSLCGGSHVGKSYD